VITLDSAIYFNAEFCEPWCLASPASSVLAPLLAGRREHVIIYHLLCEGSAWVQVEGHGRLELSAGDLVTFPHGHGHVLGSGRSVAPIDAAAALPGVLARGWNCCTLAAKARRRGSSAGSSPATPPQPDVPGRAAAAHPRQHPRRSVGAVARELPQVLRDPGTKREAGAGAMLAKLSEVVFAETLRRYVRGIPKTGRDGWPVRVTLTSAGRWRCFITAMRIDGRLPNWREKPACRGPCSRSVSGTSSAGRHGLPDALAPRAGRPGAHHNEPERGADCVRCGLRVRSGFESAFKREYGLPPAGTGRRNWPSGTGARSAEA